MKNKNLDKLLKEFYELAVLYSSTDFKDVKEHYNNYVENLINFDVPLRLQDDFRGYWDKLRG